MVAYEYTIALQGKLYAIKNIYASRLDSSNYKIGLCRAGIMVLPQKKKKKPDIERFI